MTETTQTKHYRIRKELVWIGSLSLLAYVATDWWMHLNWPPHDATYPERLAALGCPTDGRYIVTKKQIEEAPNHSSHGGALNRDIFFDNPQCAAGQYLAFEGSGVRLKTYVYDVEKKRRTATIVTTFDKYEE